MTVVTIVKMYILYIFFLGSKLKICTKYLVNHRLHMWWTRMHTYVTQNLSTRSVGASHNSPNIPKGIMVGVTFRYFYSFSFAQLVNALNVSRD